MGARELLTKADMAQLIENGRLQAETNRAYDPHPVVMLFLPYSRQCWLLSEVRPHDHDLAYGLHDDGRGTVREGEFRISDLADIKAISKARSSAIMSSKRKHPWLPTWIIRFVSGNIVTPTAYFRR